MSFSTRVKKCFFMPFAHASMKEQIQALLHQADIQINGKRPWDIQVHDEKFYTKVFQEGSLGAGNAYIEGMWDCEALDECFSRFLRAGLQSHFSSPWQTLIASSMAKLINLQDKSRSMEVIHKHYQLGNDLYQNMLDPTLTYSCGYWKNAANLEEAQQAKYDLICKKLYLRPGMRVLDIGCGWGGFCYFAAKHYGAHVVGITLSSNQRDYALKICKGLSVEIRLQDYRDIHESFDRVIEIGMFEHVGLKNYRTFMQMVHRCLKDGGIFLLHTIGANESYLTSDPWLNAYIFPNSHLPSPVQIATAVEKLFIMEDWHNFGPDYDKTLMAWYHNFNHNWDKLSETYGPAFYRMWRYYLLTCAGGFRSRNIQLWQVVLSKKGIQGGYTSIR